MLCPFRVQKCIGTGLCFSVFHPVGQLRSDPHVAMMQVITCYVCVFFLLPPFFLPSLPLSVLERNTTNGGEIQRRKISLFNVIIRGYYLNRKIEARVERNKGCHEQSIADRVRTTHFWYSEQFDWNRYVRKIIAIRRIEKEPSCFSES